ncbi:unnamed protein product [Ixodes hexagonus]
MFSLRRLGSSPRSDDLWPLSDPNREGNGAGSLSASEPGPKAHINSAFSMAEEGYGAIADRNGPEGPHEPTLSGSTVVVPWWIMEDAKDPNASNNNLDGSKPRIRIHRHAMNQEDLVKNYGEAYTDSPLSQRVKRKFISCCACTPLSLLYSIFPILHWLPRYRVREHLMNDVVAGFTVSIMHIPQGLAYGVLAHAGAINGLYVSAFPAIIYFFMGTSKHVSVGKLDTQASTIKAAVWSVTYSHDQNGGRTASQRDLTALVGTNQKTCAHACVPAPITPLHPSMYTFYRRFVSTFGASEREHYNLDSAGSRLAPGSVTSELHASAKCGNRRTISVVRDVAQNLGKTNLVTLAISATAMVACFAVHEGINARYKAKLKMPVPIDLIVIIAATTISYFGDFNQVYGVRVMGYVPTGLPVPEVPRVDLMVRLILDGFVIAIVSFTIALSMAKLFAKRHRYQIDPNQELNALGAANVVTSFFGCYPCAVSLSRSSVQEKAGGQTQLAAVISSAIVIVVILAAGPLFRTLPNCILSAVIIVALKGMLFQVRDCVNTWKVSRLDALTWIITFTSVVVLDIDIGIGAGIGFSVVTVILRTLVPYVSFLGNVPDSDIYLDVKRYKKAKIPRVKIFHFSSALYFANRDVFKNTLMESIIGKNEETSSLLENQGKYNAADEDSIAAVILDCSACVYIDSSGIETLKEILKELRDTKVVVYFACCSVPTYKVLLRSDILEMFPTPIVFPTIHDAVLHLPCTSRAAL